MTNYIRHDGERLLVAQRLRFLFVGHYHFLLLLFSILLLSTTTTKSSNR
jgi:hypothetical protein